MTKKPQLLSTIPIAETEDNMLHPRYFEQAKRYLEKELGCGYSGIQGRSYRALFPEGTVEEIYEGASKDLIFVSTIRFPNGKTLKKWVKCSQREGEKVLVALCFPQGVLRLVKEEKE